MKLSVGYQLDPPGEESFSKMLADYREHVSEVYFAWPHMASGRADIANQAGYTDWTTQARLESDLVEMTQIGITPVVLFNANCYSEKAISQSLKNQVGSVLGHLEDLLGSVETITTTSPAIAHIVKKNFPNVKIRASVNMRLGTIEAMEYLADLFDEYYVQRDFNRDFDRLRELKKWADEKGKKLNILANSGCFKFCSFQSFHDNMVAHNKEIDETRNMEDFLPFACWRELKDRKNWHKILRNTWIRPEDLENYDSMFNTVKLATRMHDRPRMVIDAYCRRKFSGNLLDLCEPGFSKAFYPYIIDNSKFPEDWFEHSINCNSYECKTCNKIFEKVLTDTRSL